MEDSPLVLFYQFVEASRSLVDSLQTAILSPNRQAEFQQLHEKQAVSHARLINRLESIEQEDTRAKLTDNNDRTELIMKLDRGNDVILGMIERLEMLQNELKLID